MSSENCFCPGQISLGAKARHSFCCICGLAEAMPLLQTSGFVEFFTEL
jgi:hypothetical protein